MCTLPPKHCLSLSSLTVVYSRQQLDSLISCCLTGPPPWIRDQSDTVNLTPLCLRTPRSLAALCFTWLSHPSCLVTSEGGYPCATNRHHRSWSWNWPGCFACWVTWSTAWTGGDLHKVRQKWISQQTFKKRNGESGEWHTGTWTNKSLNTTGRESQWHDNKHDCVYNN